MGRWNDGTSRQTLGQKHKISNIRSDVPMDDGLSNMTSNYLFECENRNTQFQVTIDHVLRRLQDE